MNDFDSAKFIAQQKFLCPVCQGEMVKIDRVEDVFMLKCINYPCNTMIRVFTAPISAKMVQCPGTRIHYMYRDGGNWKKHNHFDVKGYLNLDALVSVYCDGDNSFVPEDVGVPSLSPYDPEEVTEDDHPWHEITGMEFLMDVPENAITAEEMEQRFEEAHEMGWPAQYTWEA